MLFGQSQVRRKPPQLESPPFQLSMTSTEGLLSLFVQRAITEPFLKPRLLSRRTKFTIAISASTLTGFCKSRRDDF